MPLIALTGGIASGKSTIARRLSDHGAIVIDADALTREVQQPGTPVLAQIAAAFGDDVLDEDGALLRSRLGERVFGNPEQLSILNGIVHPAVREESARRFAAARAADAHAIIVYDVPLLVEARAGDQWDLVVVASAPNDERVRRLVEIRGHDEEDARRRIASQATDEQRRSIADVVIETGGTLEQTLAQTDALWARLSGQPAVAPNA